MSSVREALRADEVSIDLWVDIDSAMKRLHPTYRKVLDTWQRGYSQREAERLVGYCGSGHLVQKALVELLKELNDEAGA